MIPRDKVENIVNRFNELELILAKPDLKKEEFVGNSKEYSNLNDIITYARSYLKVLDDLKNTKNILEDKATDKEFYEMAELELRLLEKIKSGPKIQQIFDDRALREDLNRLLMPVRARLGLENLLLSPRVLNARRAAEIIGALTILFFGGFKAKLLIDAGQSNISYLLFLIIASIASIYALGYVLTRNVASRRGRIHLEAMRRHFADQLEANLAQIRSPGPVARAFSGAALYLIGLYGLSVLKGTTEAIFAEAFDGVAGDGDE